MAGFVFPAGYWRPIDDAARDGSCRLVTRGGMLACALWDGERWVFPATRALGRSVPLDFEPTEYHP